jgi:predicted dehydrogenase
MGTLHAQKLQARTDVCLVGAIDPEGVPPGVHPLERLPLDLDFAVVAVPTASHLSVALPLAQAGLPLLIEKPLAATVEEAEQLAAFDAITVNHIERWNPTLAVLPKDFRPRYLRAERLSTWGQRGTDVDVVLDLMSHDLDLVLQLFGSEVTEVRAIGVPVRTRGVDIAEVWLETANGGVATLTASRVSRKPVRQLRVVGADGYYSLDLRQRRAARVRFQDGELDAEPVVVPEIDALESMHADFLSAVRGDRAYPASAAQALQVVVLSQRVSAQARTRSW